MANPNLNFVVDAERLVALNSQVGLIAQKFETIARTSGQIFRNDPFSNMAVQAGRASGALSAVLRNLQAIAETQARIAGLGTLGSPSITTRPPVMGGAVTVAGAGATLTGAANFIPQHFTPGFRNQPAWGIDPKYGRGDFDKPTREAMGETIRQFAIMQAGVRTLGVQGMGPANYARAMKLLTAQEELAVATMPEGSARELMLKRLGLNRAYASSALNAFQIRQQTRDRMRARETWNQNNLTIKGYVSQLKNGPLTDAQESELQALMAAQQQALMNNPMGFTKARMRNASHLYQGFKTAIGGAMPAMADRIAKYAYSFEQQLDRGIQTGHRRAFTDGIADLRSRVDDFLGGRPAGRLAPEEITVAQQLRDEVAAKRADLARRRSVGDLAGTGHNTTSIRGVIQGLDAEVRRLDGVLNQSNRTVNTLNSSFLRLAGAVVGLQALRDLFLNATQQAVQFDRTLAQIQARSLRFGDASMRREFTTSVTQATLDDAIRTGMPIQQVAQVQETVHLAAQGSFKAKAALGSTINNLSLTTDTPASEYLGVLAPMTKAGFQADEIRSFLERSALFQSRYGVDKSRMNAFFTSFASGINALGPLADLDTLEAAARQEAAGARDMVLGSKLNRIQTGFMSAKTRTRLLDILGRNGEREALGDYTIDQILNSGSAVVSMDMISKAYKQGHLSQRELLGVAQTLDMWSGNQTFQMLSNGLDTYRNEVRADRAVVAAGGASSAQAASVAAASIGSSFDRMSNALAALTTQGITPLGGALKMLMNVVTAVSGGMSKIPFVTESVVTALGSLATAMLARKGWDWLSSSLSQSAGGEGFKGWFKNAIGTGGLIGAGIGIATGVVGAWYSHTEQQMMAADTRNSDALRAAMPELQRRIDGESNLSALVEDIMSSHARGEDVTDKRKELVALVRSQGVEEAEVLRLQAAQTSELREQKALKDAMMNSGTTRQQVAEVRRLALFAQESLIEQRWNGRGRDTEFGGAYTSNSEQLVDALKKYAPADQRAYYDARYQESYDRLTGFGRAYANRKELGADVARQQALNMWAWRYKENLEWMGTYGVKVSPVGYFGQNLTEGYAQRTRLLEQQNSESYLNSAAAMRRAAMDKRAFGGNELLGFTRDATQSAIYGSVKEDQILGELRKLPRDFATELAAVMKQQFDEADSRVQAGTQSQAAGWGILRGEYLRLSGRSAQNTTGADFSTWLYSLTDGQLNELYKRAPNEVNEIRLQKMRLKMMPVLTDTGRGPAPERQGGGGGAINYLSILEKYFSGVERAFGQGDFSGVDTISRDFAAMSQRLTGKDYKDPITTIRELEELSVKSAEANYKNQLREVQLNKLKRPKDQLDVEVRLLEARFQQELETIRSMATMSIQKASPEGRRKAARKLLDEAFKQNLDERQGAAWDAAYGGLDLSTASDDELAVAKLVMGGKLARSNQASLRSLRSADLETLRKAHGIDFVDYDAAMQHITRLEQQQALDLGSNQRGLARLVYTQSSKVWDVQASARRAWTSAGEIFGSDDSRRALQATILGDEQEALQKRLELAEQLQLSEEERLDLAVKIKNLDVERLKLSEEMVQAQKLKQVGEDTTRQTLSTLFLGDPATRNKSLADLWTKLPMQGVTDSLTRTLIGMGEDNPIGSMARFMFDPGGEMTYKENIARLNDSIINLVAATDRLANAYLASSGRAMDGYRSLLGVPTGNPLRSSAPFSLFNQSYAYNPRTGTFDTSTPGGIASPVLGDSPARFAIDYSQFRLNDTLGFSGDFSGLDFSGYSFGAAGAGLALAGTGDYTTSAPVETTPAERAAMAVASTAGQGSYNTRGALAGVVSTGLGAFGGGSFWKPANAYTLDGKPVGGARGVAYNSKGGVSMTGAGWGVAGAQMAMAGYSGYAAGKASGSQAAANWGAAGGAMGAFATIAFVNSWNPVGWVMLAGAALAQIMAGTEAAAKAAEDKTKAYKKQEADFMRQIAINEEQRKQLGLAADRVLSERADIGNAFTGVAASAFLSGRFAANAMQVNVQNLQVVANNPQELSAALAGAFTQQVGRGI